MKEGQENVVSLDLGDGNTIKATIKYLYTAQYPAHSAYRPLFNFHAQMYVVADFYDIASLRKRAEQIFEADAKLLHSPACQPAFFAMTRTLYTSEEANEERLRQIITLCTNRAMPMLLKPTQGKKVEILELIEEYPAFARDLVVASSALMESVKSVNWRLKCEDCDWVWATAPREDTTYYDSDGESSLSCPACHIGRSWEEWEECKVERDWCQ